jgi:hypothetical protein
VLGNSPGILAHRPGADSWDNAVMSAGSTVVQHGAPRERGAPTPASTQDSTYQIHALVSLCI